MQPDEYAQQQQLEQEFQAIKLALQGTKFKLVPQSRRGWSWTVKTLGWNYKLSHEAEQWQVKPENTSLIYQELIGIVQNAVARAKNHRL
uniref:Uncharacterized protein n=1 Tax=Oscillatoriales cyanobacterium SpSt-402 TaxID=2282168 RepID=A0A832H4U2_9CYAN